MSTVDTILVDEVPGETRVALLSGGRLVEIVHDRDDPRWRVGAIHLGRVGQVVKGYEAAFVDVGIAQPAFLRLADAPERPVPGASLAVQIVRATAGPKGLTATGRLRLPGRRVDWLLDRPGARAPDKATTERLAGLLGAEEGAAWRRGAPDADAAVLAAEMERLRAAALRLRAAARAAEPPACLLEGRAPAVAAVLLHEPALVLTEGPALAERLRRALETEAPDLAGRVQPHGERDGLFAAHGVDDAVAAALLRTVPLAGGGRLTFDQAEALTAIDVDAGADPRPPAVVNRQAVRAVAGALRLRNIGGQVLIDFPRMAQPGARDELVRALREATADDPEPVEVVGWSRLGLLELTRRRAHPSLAELLVDPAAPPPALPRARAFDALRAVRAAARGPGATATIEAAPDLAAALDGPLAERVAALGRELAIRIRVRPRGDIPGAGFHVLFG